MLGSFLTRSLALIFGYAYPAYECFKTVELNKPDIEQLLFWCQYWILVAALTVFERVGDNFISWLPMYSEAKLAFFVYLWYPKTKGTTYVYETFFRPYVAKHESEIDRNLLELRTRAGDMAFLYFQKVATYGQTRIFEVLQYVASQAPSQSSRTRPVQQQQQQQQQPQQIRRTRSTAAAREPADKQQKSVPSSPTRSKLPEPQKTSNPPTEAAREPADKQQKSVPSSPTRNKFPEPQKSSVPPTEVVANVPSADGPSQSNPETTSLQPSTSENEALQAGPANPSDKETSKEDPAPSIQESPIEEALRVTRARLRRRAAAAGPSAP